MSGSVAVSYARVPLIVTAIHDRSLLHGVLSGGKSLRDFILLPCHVQYWLSETHCIRPRDGVFFREEQHKIIDVDADHHDDEHRGSHHLLHPSPSYRWWSERLRPERMSQMRRCSRRTHDSRLADRRAWSSRLWGCDPSRI